MGNRIVCCRDSWIQFYNTDETDYFTKCNRELFSYQNGGADFSDELIRTVDTTDLLPYYYHHYTDTKDVSKSNDYHNIIQHISEREPEDFDLDPSLNASKHALFLSNLNWKSSDRLESNDCYKTSTPLVFNNNYNNAFNINDGLESALKKWSSCSTIYIGCGCLACPDVYETTWSVSVAIESLVGSEINRYLSSAFSLCNNNHSGNNLALEEVGSQEVYSLYYDIYEAYDERKHPLNKFSHCIVSSSFLLKDLTLLPQRQSIKAFLSSLFSMALLGPECIIVALIFLERLVSGAEVAITAWSWRRQILACVLLASKVLDDQAVWNIDYCQILREVHVEDLNLLERHTLRLLQFNIDVPFAVYARYYFDLLTVGRQCCTSSNLPNQRRRLTTDLARQLRLLPSTTRSLSLEDYNASNQGALFDLPNVVSKVSNPKLAPKCQRKIDQTTSSQRKFVKTPHISKCWLAKDRGGQLTTNQHVSVANRQSDGAISCRPIELDDETEFVNSIGCDATMARPSVPTSQVDAVPLQPIPFSLFSTNCRRNVIVNLSDHDGVYSDANVDHLSGCCVSTSNSIVLSPPSSGAFISSLMGGDMACTLLRDAGMY